MGARRKLRLLIRSVFLKRFDVQQHERKYLRLLTSGTVGILFRTKGIHDDGNAVFAPGIWQSVQEDPKNQVRFKFITSTDTISFRSTEKRFMWFSGIVPHTTVTESEEVQSDVPRIHHSSYIKITLEQIALSCPSTTII